MDLFVILGLEPGASIADVKRAYRRLARKYHPDINPGDRAAAELFRRIVEAYETLSDPDRRHRYETRERAPAEFEPTYQFEGFDFSAMTGAAPGTFGDLFADLLQAPPAARPERGADLHARLAITFEEAMAGGERGVTVTRLEHCYACRGTGVVSTVDTRCPPCQGTGSVRWARGHMIFSKNCAACGGTGRQRSRPCGTCNREGVLARVETLSVTIPPGIADQADVRVPGRGHVGRRGGAPGDLHVTVQVAPHPLFRRDGDDLLIVVPIGVQEAALGARVEIPTIDGPARLRVPPGTQSGQRFRLRGRGAPSPHDGRRGDLVAEARIVLPRILDERSKQLLREFGRIQTEDVRADWGGRTVPRAANHPEPPGREGAA
jgi:molecular chaperone DnaJ